VSILCKNHDTLMKNTAALCGWDWQTKLGRQILLGTRAVSITKAAQNTAIT
jgi:hypothetical protein